MKAPDIRVICVFDEDGCRAEEAVRRAFEDFLRRNGK